MTSSMTPKPCQTPTLLWAWLWGGLPHHYPLCQARVQGWEQDPWGPTTSLYHHLVPHAGRRVGDPVASQTPPCSRSLQHRAVMPPGPSTQLPMPISAWHELAQLRKYQGTWKSPMAQAQHSQATERLGGHFWARSPVPWADCCRAGLALSWVDFILLNGHAKAWAAFVQGVLEGIPSMDKAGSGRAPCTSCTCGAGMGHCHPPASRGTGLARGGSRGGWPGLQPRAWGSSAARQGGL